MSDTTLWTCFYSFNAFFRLFNLKRASINKLQELFIRSEEPALISRTVTYALDAG